MIEYIATAACSALATAFWVGRSIVTKKDLHEAMSPVHSKLESLDRRVDKVEIDIARGGARRGPGFA